MKKIVSLLITLALGLGLVTQNAHCANRASEPKTGWTFARFPAFIRSACFISAGIGAGYRAKRAYRDQSLDTLTQFGASTAIFAALGTALGIVYFNKQKHLAEKEQQQKTREQQQRRAEWQKLTGCTVSLHAKIEDLEEGIAHIHHKKMIEQTEHIEKLVDNLPSNSAPFAEQDGTYPMKLVQAELKRRRYHVENLMRIGNRKWDQGNDRK